MTCRPRRKPANATACGPVAGSRDQVGIVIALAKLKPAGPRLAGVVRRNPEVALAGYEASEEWTVEPDDEQMFAHGAVGSATGRTRVKALASLHKIGYRVR